MEQQDLMNELNSGKVERPSNGGGDRMIGRSKRAHDTMNQKIISCEKVGGEERVGKETMSKQSVSSNQNTPKIYKFPLNVNGYDLVWSTVPETSEWSEWVES
jgi:hypothetical protein